MKYTFFIIISFLFISFACVEKSNDIDYLVGSKTLLSVDDLKDFSKEELRLIRNGIFAKHGYIFKSKELNEFYSQYDWYKPQYENVDKELTEIERKNISLIQSVENNKPLSEKNQLNYDFELATNNVKYSFLIDTIIPTEEPDKLVDKHIPNTYQIEIFKNGKQFKNLTLSTDKFNFFISNNNLLYETFYSFPATGFDGYYELKTLDDTVFLISNESNQLYEIRDNNTSRWISLYHYTDLKKFEKGRDPSLTYRKAASIIYSSEESIIEIIDICYKDGRYPNPKISINSSYFKSIENEDLFCKRYNLKQDYVNFDSVFVDIEIKGTKLHNLLIIGDRIEFTEFSENEELKLERR